MADLPDPLARSIVDADLDRVRIDLTSVWDPMPLGIAVSCGLLFIWPTVGTIIGTMLRVWVPADWFPLAVCLGGVFAALVATLPALAQGGFETTGLRLELTARFLTVVRVTRLQEHSTPMPWSEITAIEERHRRLCIQTPSGWVSVPMDGRSKQTLQALEGWLHTQHARLSQDGDPAEIPPQLLHLTGSDRRQALGDG